MKTPLGLLPTLLAAPALASDVLVVDPNQAGAFPTIQDAVHSAANGDVILVRAGTYPESVAVTGTGLTLVADGVAHIDGTVEITAVPAGASVLLGGFSIEASLNSRRPGLELNGADGAVRVVDCVLIGSTDGGQSSAFIGDTGPGASARNSRDVAFVDCQLTGGTPSTYAGLPVGLSYVGAPGLDATDVDRLSLIRSVCRGAQGSSDIFGAAGDGGDGAHLVDCQGAWIAYSAFFGGEGGISDPTAFAPSGDGGTGFFADGPGVVWNLAGVFAAGQEGCASGSFCNPGLPGAPTGGGALTRTLAGFPSSLSAPLIVREGQAYDAQIISLPGETVRLAVDPSTGFGFRRGAKQPLLVARPAPQTFSPVGTVQANQRLDLTYTARPIPGGADAQVLWIQATLEDGVSPLRLSSPRPIVFLDASF